jgi:predicted negative regulator of RcsB-dependent stress response
MRPSFKHLAVTLAGLLALLVLPLPVQGQGTPAPGERRDLVELTSGAKLSGKVIEESWKGLKLDKDLDGKSDETIELDKVKTVTYGDRPDYLVKAILLVGKTDKQQEYIEALSRAYFDKNTSKWQLQHAYYKIAQEYEKLSVTDEQYVAKALDAYQKLLDDIPDSRYAPQLRMNLGDLFLARGELDRARKNFQGAIGSGFTADIETRARIRQAQTFLLENKPDQAETTLNQVPAAGLSPLNAAELTVLKADVLTTRGQYDKAYDMLLGVITDKKAAAIEPEAYEVLGDIFRLQNKNEEALLAYLRVHLMYGDVDAVAHARALVGAVKAANRLNRKEQARALQEELLRRHPGSLWAGKLRE